MSALGAFSALIRRDIRLAWAQGGAGALSLSFFLIAITLFPFGLGPDKNMLARLAPGLIWVVALLAGLLSLDRLYQADYEDGSLDSLMLSPLPLELMVIAKTIAHWVGTVLPLIIIAPVLAMMLNLADGAYGWLFVSLLVGTPSLSLLGSIGAALTVAIRRGGVLLALLILPLYIPALIFGALVVESAAVGEDPIPHLALLGAFSLISLFIAPFASAAALRLALE